MSRHRHHRDDDDGHRHHRDDVVNPDGAVAVPVVVIRIIVVYGNVHVYEDRPDAMITAHCARTLVVRIPNLT